MHVLHEPAPSIKGAATASASFFFPRMLRPAASEFITIASSFFLLFFFRRLRFLVQQRQTHSLVRIRKGRHSRQEMEHEHEHEQSEAQKLLGAVHTLYDTKWKETIECNAWQQQEE